MNQDKRNKMRGKGREEEHEEHKAELIKDKIRNRVTG
jgi:hypothetical protein